VLTPRIDGIEPLLPELDAGADDLLSLRLIAARVEDMYFFN